MKKTKLATRIRRQVITLAERVTSNPFRVVPDIDPAVYDDPDFMLTIRIETLDEVTGKRRGMVSRHTGRPMGKSRRWAAGMMAPPVGLKTIITVEANKQADFGVDLEEADAPVVRTVQEHRSIAFDEFDYAETASSQTSLGVTGVTVDAGDFLVAKAGVFNSSGSTMDVSDATNGTWTVPTGSPVLADANSQAHIQYFTNSGALSAATVTFDPVGTSSDIDAVVAEISGAATSGFDQYVENTGSIPGGGTSPPPVDTGTLAQANNLIFGIFTHSGSTGRALGAGASFTLIAEDEDNSTSQCFFSERLTTATSATTPVTVNGSIGLGDGFGYTWAIAAIVVKEAAAAGDENRIRFPAQLEGMGVGGMLGGSRVH